MFPSLDLRGLADRKVQEFLAPFFPGLLALAAAVGLDFDAAVSFAQTDLIGPYAKTAIVVAGTFVLGLGIMLSVALLDTTLGIFFAAFLIRRSKLDPSKDDLWRKAVSEWVPPTWIPMSFETADQVNLRVGYRLEMKQGPAEITLQELNDTSRSMTADAQWGRIYGVLSNYFGINSNIPADQGLVLTVTHASMLVPLAFLIMSESTFSAFTWVSIIILNVIALAVVLGTHWSVQMNLHNAYLQIAFLLRKIEESSSAKAASQAKSL